MPELSTVTDPNLPEPKGASTATAGQVYVADGAGGGAWTVMPGGFGVYNGAAGDQVISTTPGIMDIDGLGATTQTSYLPLEIRGSGDLWDTVANKIDPIAEGDVYELRLDIPVTAKSGSPTEMTIELDIQAGSTYADRISILSRFAATAKAAPYTISAGFPVYVGSTFIVNGCLFWLYTDAGTVTITNPTITLVRVSGELV